MSEDLDISDVDGVCRLCLKGDGTIIPIFGRENTSRDCIPLSKKIFNCVSVEVINGDGMSNMICVGCVHQVDSWNGFKNTCESSQIKLMQWLHKHKPDIFEKNEARRHARNSNSVQINADESSSAVIDLSSEDEEVAIARKPVSSQLVGSHRQRCLNKSVNRPVNKPVKKLSFPLQSSHSQNLEAISLSTCEDEILPENHEINESGKQNLAMESENASSTGLPDVVTGVDAFSKDPESTENLSSCDGHTLQVIGAIPETSNNFIIDNSQNINPEDESVSKTLSTSNSVDDINHVFDIQSLNENNAVTSIENQNIESIFQQDNVSDIEFLEEGLEASRENDLFDETNNVNIDDDPLTEKRNSNIEKDKELFTRKDHSSSASESTASAEKRNLDKDPLVSSISSNATGSEEMTVETESNLNNKALAPNSTVSLSSSISTDLEQATSKVVENTPVDSSKTGEETADNSVDNDSTFMIREVTSLSSAGMVEEEREQEENVTDDDMIDDGMNQSVPDDDHVTWSSQEESTSDVRPDIVMCDSPTINIKEEPLSAPEDVDEDPLDFQTVLIKNEMDNSQFESELEDVKPNVRQVNEVSSDQYAPKRLKCGKPRCEPCRVSFSSDVSYERHTFSLRHKLNLKLFKSGRGPTKIGTRSLKNALMGNVHDVPMAAPSRGPYCCNYCPSKFQHLRNLKTHQKKHLHGYMRKERPSASARVYSESGAQGVDVTSKPPVRQSARNLSFAEIPEFQCELCDHTFNGMKGLVSHKRFCGLTGTHVCIHCGKALSTAGLLLKHKRVCESNSMNQNSNQSVGRDSDSTLPEPADGPVVTCTLCNLNFHSSKDLITHMQKNHMDFGNPQSPVEVPNFAKPNQFSGIRDSSLHYCKYCPRSFPTYGALSSHTGYHSRKSVYFCKFCRQNHRDKVSFRQHMRVHISDPSNRNVCWICYTPFNSQLDLIDHKKNHAMKMTIFPCGFCGNSYNTKELLIKHKRAEHYRPHPPDLTSVDVHKTENMEKQVQIIDEDNKLFKCKTCKKKFSSLGNLKRHAKAHKYGLHGSSNPASQHFDHSGHHRCVWCFKAFRTPSGLLNHRPLCNKVKTSSGPIGAIPGNPVKCKGCKKWFASKNSLYKHTVMGRCLGEKEPSRVETVSAVRPKNCTNCDQQFLSEETLSRHKQNCKPSMDRLTCDCGEIFSSVEGKLEHTETCSANCTCKVCNMKFNSPEELESHRLVCSTQNSSVDDLLPENPQLECHKCNKRFVYSKCLQIHLEKCLYNNWPCSACQEVFPSESAMALHRKTSCYKQGKSSGMNQIDMGPVKCEYCLLRFTSHDDLMQHTSTCQRRLLGQKDQVASSYRPFSCEYCGKTFIWKANMYRHVKMAHLNRTRPSSSNTSVLNTDNNLSNLIEPDNTSVFQCKLCPDIIFHKQQGFLEHQMMHNQQGFREPDSTSSIENMLTCELCDKKLPESLYPMHMDEHMNDDFEECNKDQQLATSSKETNDQHSNNESMSNETVSKGYSCDLCGKTFSSPVSRKSHRAHHFRAGQGYISTKKLFQNKKHIRCKICNKLLSVNSIHKHNMMHARQDAEFYAGVKTSTPLSLRSTSQQSKVDDPSPEETSADLPCPKCDQVFATRVLLMDHLKAHTDDSFETESMSSGVGSVDQHPYKCVYCDLSWKYKSVYERHLGSKKHLEVQKQLSGII